MSTRATVHFRGQFGDRAIVYRHLDGYPDGIGKDLQEFLNECQILPDNRFDDPSYLAAKWVVADSARFIQKPADHRLSFLSVGIVLEDPPDIEYRYTVVCTGGIPQINVEKIR